MSASVGGECVVQSLLKKIEDSSAAGLTPAAATTEGRIAMLYWSAPDLASGWAARTAFFCDVAQQVLFVQQPDWHAFSPDAFAKMHDRAEIFADDAANAATTNIEVMILLSIESSYSTS